MRERIGDFKLSKRALARNYKLIFNVYSKKFWQGYTANIQHTGNFDDRVLGVVYHISEAQLSKLQLFEGHAASEISVEMEDGNEIKNAKTFVWDTPEREHEPPETYRRRMVDGLIEHGYSRLLVEKIFVDKFGH
jgi:gamma-glutamylcyclotransferase (GGCT)/AIG2-like uncharacterized protein YtfP